MGKFRMAELRIGATCKFREKQKCFQLQLSGVVAPVAEEASAAAHTAKRRWKMQLHAHGQAASLSAGKDALLRGKLAM